MRRPQVRRLSTKKAEDQSLDVVPSMRSIGEVWRSA